MKRRKSDSRLYRGRKLDVDLREDPRSENYRMADVIPAAMTDVFTKYWECPEIFDQGREGKCVGYAGIHWFGSAPFIQKISHAIADMFYAGAQRNDERPGENYEGTSITGLMAYLKSKGHIDSYRWVRSMLELQQTICHHGPVVVGCEWREGCFEPDRDGFITFTGELRGGHATVWRGVNMEQGYILIQQSWGINHGIDGSVRMRFAEVQKLLRTHPQITLPLPIKRLLTMTLPPKRPWWKFWR